MKTARNITLIVDGLILGELSSADLKNRKYILTTRHPRVEQAILPIAGCCETAVLRGVPVTPHKIASPITAPVVFGETHTGIEVFVDRG
jgi:hypothetical protein